MEETLGGSIDLDRTSPLPVSCFFHFVTIIPVHSLAHSLALLRFLHLIPLSSVTFYACYFRSLVDDSHQNLLVGNFDTIRLIFACCLRNVSISLREHGCAPKGLYEKRDSSRPKILAKKLKLFEE